VQTRTVDVRAPAQWKSKPQRGAKVASAHLNIKGTAKNHPPGREETNGVNEQFEEDFSNSTDNFHTESVALQI
jgi:hypothetical protein